MVAIFQELQRLRPIRALVIGDLMLDVYHYGVVSRISPEAPVPIFSVKRSESLPGGAGNVALNLAELGAEVTLVGSVGADTHGRMLESLMEASAIRAHFVRTKACPTCVKKRLIADGQHLMRLDEEEIISLKTSEQRRVMSFLTKELKQFDVIAVSDYGKGFLTEEVIAHIMELAKKHDILTLVDPKGADYEKYTGAYLIKPNLKEAYAAARLPLEADLADVAAAVRKQLSCEHLLITRSEKGMTLFSGDKNQRADYAVSARAVVDVCGAGDTALGMLAFALGNGLEMPAAIALSNIASSITVQKVGCYSVSLQEIATELLEHQTQDKLFDERHLDMLLMVLKDQEVELVHFDLPPKITNTLFEALQTLAVSSKKRLLMIPEESNNPSLINFLASFDAIDYIALASNVASRLDEELQITGNMRLSQLELSPIT